MPQTLNPIVNLILTRLVSKIVVRVFKNLGQLEAPRWKIFMAKIGLTAVSTFASTGEGVNVHSSYHVGSWSSLFRSRLMLQFGPVTVGLIKNRHLTGTDPSDMPSGESCAAKPQRYNQQIISAKPQSSYYEDCLSFSVLLGTDCSNTSVCLSVFF